jgi:hypothetical protein
MALAERITSYTVWVAQTDYLSYTRVITMKLESGTTVYIGFPEVRRLTGCSSRRAPSTSS